MLALAAVRSAADEPPATAPEVGAAAAEVRRALWVLAEEMRKAVRLHCREGVDNIKLDVSGDPFYAYRAGTLGTPDNSTPMHFDEIKAAVDTVVRDIRNSARLPGVDRIWLPGEQSHGKRQRYADQGIPVPLAVKQDLDALSEQLQVPKLVTL